MCQFIYKITGAKFVKRSAGEIKELYDKWLSGELVLKGITSEIEAYFNYVLESYKFIDSEQNKI